MTVIGIISDIHGNLPALEAVVHDLASRGITDVINLGDHASGPLWPSETVALLMRQPWRQIRGNHDRQVVQDAPSTHGDADRYAFAQLSEAQRRWLAALPATAEHASGVFLCHGTPESDMEFLLEGVAHDRFRLMSLEAIRERLGEIHPAVVCCGHSHTPRAVQAGDTLIINPGSVGLQAFADRGPPAYRCESGAPHARYAILEQREGRWSVQHMAVEYDWGAAARRAEQNDQPVWAYALRTGFVR